MQQAALLSPKKYYDFLCKRGCNFFAGVPDSLLKAFCACVTERAAAGNHQIAANEGAAVGLAIGAHLASGAVPVVYMQNSGLGNALNPLMSMADPLVYGIPLLLLIGWRGELGQGQQESGEQLKDEPQHRQQGRVTLDWLRTSAIPYEILPCEERAAQDITGKLLQRACRESRPVALIVRKNTFSSYQSPPNSGESQDLKLGREEAISLLLAQFPPGPIVSTTGMISRELFEQRQLCLQGSEENKGHERDFLVVGAMGHASSIAMGVALEHQGVPVYCLDGDGSLLMHMGSLALLGQSSCNVKHIILNNGAHDSVGGQPTLGLQIDIPSLARSCGYRWTARVKGREDLQTKVLQLLKTPGPALLEVQVRRGARADLGRPTLGLQQIKAKFRSYLARE